MNRNLVKGLLVAWQLPEFRAGLQHLIDLDEVTALLAALALPRHDRDSDREAALVVPGQDHHRDPYREADREADRAADREADREVERSLLRLLRSALDTAEIRQAVLLLLEQDGVRRPLLEGLAQSIVDRPGLAAAIASAAEDPVVRRELRAALESPKVRELLLQAAENQFSGKRWALIRRIAVLFVRHRSVRRLAWSLRRHGLLRELREATGES